MSYTETSSEGFLSRIKGAIVGVLVGLLLFFGSFVLLWFNEGNAVKAARALEEGAAAVVSVKSDAVDKNREGKLVHVVGEASAPGQLRDPDFGVEAEALKLVRNVEMYQWQEDVDSRTRKKLGGGTETVKTYSYRKVWSSKVIYSRTFKENTSHENPTRYAFGGAGFRAEKVFLGAFRLPSELVERIQPNSRITVDQSRLAKVSSRLRSHTVVSGGNFYYSETGGKEGAPHIGDMRVSFSQAPPQTVSVIAQQSGDSFSAYRASNGRELQLLYQGRHKAEQMFKSELEKNAMLAWILRGLGFFLMLVGCLLLGNPLNVLADVLPILGDLVGMGLFLLSLFVAVIGSTVTISLAWVFYRPLIGIPLLVFALVMLVLMFKMRRPRAAQA